jgi:hypothetical protein
MCGMGFSPSANRQLQHVGVDDVFPFSGHSLCRWPPPHQKQRAGCLQFAQTWPNCWQLWHCLRPFWALYASTLIAMWHRLGIRHPLSESNRVRNTLRLAVYRLSLRLGQEPFKTHDQNFFLNWTPKFIVKHNRSEMVAVLGPFEDLPYYIHSS